MRSGFWLWAALLAGTLTSAASAADYYVDNGKGKDGNSGLSIDQPLKTLAKASPKLTAGDTLHIANTGTPYYEPLLLHGLAGTAQKPIVIEGNMAVLSGLVDLREAPWQEKEAGLWFLPRPKMSSNCHPYLLLSEIPLPQVKTAAELQEGRYLWDDNGILFRPQAGKKPSALPLTASQIDSGVGINTSRYLVIRNLISERHANDGYNIHGDAQCLLFENIVSRYNGDDGFSIHEDGSAVVRNGWFHHNDYGIEDINATNSSFYGVLLEDNATGAHFSGGWHLLNHVTMRNNRVQLQLSKGVSSTYLGSSREGVPFETSAEVKNLLVQGGERGLIAGPGTRLSLLHTEFRDCATGLNLKSGSTVWLRNYAVTGCKDWAYLDEGSKGQSAEALFSEGSVLRIAGKTVPLAEFPGGALTTDPVASGANRHGLSIPPFEWVQP